MKEKIVRGIMVPVIVFLLSGLGIKSGTGYEPNMPIYSLQITLNASTLPFLNFQSISPIDVSFQLKNLGNETFNGTVTLSASTDKHSYDEITFNVTNLATNATYSNSTSYSTGDEGNYYFTLQIESNDFSIIKLYQNSTLLSQGFIPSVKAYVFFHSFTEFMAILAIVVGAIVTIAVGVFSVKKRKKS